MSTPGEQVLITGGLGFIGSELAHQLVPTNAAVRILDASLPDYGSNPANIESIRDEVKIIEADVRNQDAISETVRSSDTVYHLAAQLSRTTSNRQPGIDADINCEGFLNVLSAARAAEDSPRVVFTSSQAVVGSPPSLPFDETTPASPVDVYGANKRAGELYCDIFHETHGVQTVSVRLSNVYGPRAQLSNPNYGVINNFISSALTDDVLTVFEPGTMQRDFVYVTDVARGLRQLATAEAAIGERYVIGSGTPTTIEEIAHEIVSIAESGTVKHVPWPEDWDSIQVGDLYTDPTKISSRHGWEPEIGLEQGIKKTIEFYRNHASQYI